MQASSTFNTILGLSASVALLAVFYSPAVRRSQLWTITVTPLASIIGSGFLITAPLLYDEFGSLAVPAIILINLFALSVGLVIRNNIKYFDPHRLAMVRRVQLLGILERLANWALGLSYIISIAFYVTLLGAFGLELAGGYSAIGVKLLSSVILAFIAGVGYTRGLHGLESLEKVAVKVNLSIIGGLLLVLLVFNLLGGNGQHVTSMPQLNGASFALLGGMLLIVQGFETAKYLGRYYEAGQRVRAMLLAQLIASVVYILFVWWVAPLVIGVDAASETAIIRIISKLATGLGVALSVGAIFSQFSAAVADTVGTGGIAAGEANGRFSERQAYVVIAAAAIALLWVFDIFSVLALASRAFAAYYSLQGIIAIVTVWHHPRSTKRTWKLIVFPVLTLALIMITLFAIPAEAAGKTGTAEAGDGGESHAWFASFAPYDDPEIVVVFLRNGGQGSSRTAPLARNVLEVYHSLPLTPPPDQTPEGAVDR